LYVFTAELVENASTRQQYALTAETKTAVSAKTLGRRSSRDAYTSSSNLKIKTQTNLSANKGGGSRSEGR
jgi:hypothetical protein